MRIESPEQEIIFSHTSEIEECQCCARTGDVNSPTNPTWDGGPCSPSGSDEQCGTTRQASRTLTANVVRPNSPNPMISTPPHT